MLVWESGTDGTGGNERTWPGTHSQLPSSDWEGCWAHREQPAYVPVRRPWRARCCRMPRVPIPTLCYTSCVTFSTSLTLSVPRFPHLLNGVVSMGVTTQKVWHSRWQGLMGSSRATRITGRQSSKASPLCSGCPHCPAFGVLPHTLFPPSAVDSGPPPLIQD